MLSKKPLVGVTCASCEKKLVNMTGLPVDYNPWGKFPFRDPQDRLARVGQGFSKMLGSLKPSEMSMNKSKQEDLSVM